jgi:hypothetical protein
MVRSRESCMTPGVLMLSKTWETGNRAYSAVFLYLPRSLRGSIGADGASSDQTSHFG